MIKSGSIKLFVFLFIILLVSCKTIKQPESVVSPLDYTADDVVKNEIENIRRIKKDNPVQALWRASFLKQDDIKSVQSKVRQINVIQ